MRDHPNDYILENTTIEKITLSDLLAHTTDSINTAKRAFFDIQAETIELNTGFFTNTSPVIDFPLVSVTQLHNTLILSCPCKAIKKKLCEHQVQVLFNIMEQPYLRVFYDSKLRQQKLKEFAKEYGLENEADLDDFFEIEPANRNFTVKPRIKELIKVNETTKSQLQEQLLPKKSQRLKEKLTETDLRKTVLVIRKRKYYDQLNIELYEGEATKGGKIKNPSNHIRCVEFNLENRQD
jgi:hypothetical protein